MIKTPIIIINFKTYEQATGKKAEILAKACEDASIESGKSVALAVQDTDLYRVSKSVKLPILAEHLDMSGLGGFTGKDTFLALTENGAIGSLINHSEDRMPINIIKDVISVCKNNNLISIVCAQDENEAEKLAVFNPDFIAVEPPELIGGDISVSTSKPEIITNTINKVKKINSEIKILCGAGIKSKKDVEIAIKLGSDGILLASGITKSENPKETLKELLSKI